LRVLVGYARVSTPEQDLALQLDALQAPNCDKVYEEEASGVREQRHPFRQFGVITNCPHMAVIHSTKFNFYLSS
jgi:predicted site-specific integrase-resolvase